MDITFHSGLNDVKNDFKEVQWRLIVLFLCHVVLCITPPGNMYQGILNWPKKFAIDSSSMVFLKKDQLNKFIFMHNGV